MLDNFKFDLHEFAIDRMEEICAGQKFKEANSIMNETIELLIKEAPHLVDKVEDCFYGVAFSMYVESYKQGFIDKCNFFENIKY